MTPRTIHIGTSFLTVLVAFWTYLLLAVPLIEPPAATHARADDRGLEEAAANDDNNFKALFPPGAWELDKPKIINIDSTRILWQTYTNLSDGWVELKPVTILFLPDDPTLPMAERIRSAIVMEDPQGAKLRFDPPLVIGRAKAVPPTEGKLRGQVTIRSRGKPGNNQGDLHIVTSDVSLNEQCIWTPNAVDFRWGPHFGVGRQMRIKLLPRQGPAAGNSNVPNIGGIEECEFQTVERLHLDLSRVSDAKPTPGSIAGQAKGTAAAGASRPVTPFFHAPGDGAGPVEITCHGPFHFNVVQQTATFKDQVDVFRVQPSGPSDHLSCEQLSIFFVHSSGTAASKSGPAGLDLQPQRMEAIGTPAKVTAPAEQFEALGDHMTYDVVTGEIAIDSKQEVTLKKESSEIHARNLHYTPSKEAGRIGTVVSQGPGTLHAQMADRPGQILDARWNDYLKVVPKDQNDVISLTGGATLNFQALGRLDGKEIYFWLKERPAKIPGGQNKLDPDRLLAIGSVRGDSPQLSTVVDRMEVWFTAPPPLSAAVIGAAGSPAPPAIGNHLGPSEPQNGAARSPQFESSGTAAATSERPQQHMEITGRLLQARVTMRDDQHGELTEATVIDNVVLRETQTSQPGEQPLLVTGQRLAATDVAGPQAKVRVVGEPAHMEGRNLKLTGPNIELDRGENRLIMRGPGQMEVPIDRNLDGSPLPAPQPLQIDWQTQMTFDGLTAEFVDGVTARGKSQLLQTKLLKMRLQNRVSFAHGDPQHSGQQPKPEEILCDGGAYIENRGFDVSQQMQSSLERIQLAKLIVNMVSGDINGAGPGWVVSVRRGEAAASIGGGKAGFGSAMLPGQPVPTHGHPMGGPLTAGASGPQTPFGGNDPAMMKCLHLKFLGGLRGNLYRKEITFSKQVRAAYANAASWLSTLESDDPEQLGPEAVILHCDELSVVDLSPNGQADKPHGVSDAEMLAVGNVLAEGTASEAQGGGIFTAHSTRMTYAQRKDMLVFEGDGRTEADFCKQKREGAKADHFSAQKIIYSIKSGQATVDGARSLDMDFLGGKLRGTR